MTDRIAEIRARLQATKQVWPYEDRDRHTKNKPHERVLSARPRRRRMATQPTRPQTVKPLHVVPNAEEWHYM